MASKPPKLTMAQVYTLRRMKSGTQYIMSGNGRHAEECRADCSSRGWHPVKSASLPVLFRLGLVEIEPLRSGHPVNWTLEPTKYYPVRLTQTGRMILTLTKDRKE